MDNFQLYRTNINLSGQLKWDLILKPGGENLIVQKLLLSPISELLNYDKYTDDDVLKYTHGDNIRKLYTSLGDSFFTSYADASLLSEYPIITDDKCINAHIGDYEMGCRRNKTYKIQNKQYYFLCPVWLEKLSQDETIVFEISAFSEGKKISSKTVSFAPVISTSDAEDYHNRFVTYFKNYLNSVSIHEGNNNVINVDHTYKKMTLSGVDVSSGEYVHSLDSYEPYNNMMFRERALLETDEEIISQFPENKLISSQLFNFALYFNPEDILPIMFIDEMIGKFVTYKVTVSIGNYSTSKYKDLELVDFFSNYEYIPRVYCGPADTTFKEDIKDDQITQPNVLSYMLDFKNINLLTKNKMLQNTIHWSLDGNNDYIFNVYPGFSGFSIINDKIVYNNGVMYMDSPDVASSKYSKTSNNMGWSNWITINSQNQLWGNFDKFRKISSNFKSEWIHNIYYNPVWKKIDLKANFALQGLKYSSDQIIDFCNDDLNVLLVYNKSNKDISANFPQLNNFYLGERIALYNYKVNGKTIQFILYNHTAEWGGNPSGYYDESLNETTYNASNYTLIITSRYPDLLTFKGFYELLRGKISKFKSLYDEDVDGYGYSTDYNEDDKVKYGLIWALRKDLNNEIDNLLGNDIQGKAFVHQSYPVNKPYKRYLLHILTLLSASLYASDYDNIPLIQIQNSIYLIRAITPLANSTEIMFNKKDGVGPKLYRYFGKIKPTFIKPGDKGKFNYLYYKDYLSNTDKIDEFGATINSPWKNSIYSKLGNITCGYVLPSVNYYAIKKLDQNLWTYDKLPIISNSQPISADIEYQWFNNGINIVLLDNIECKLESKMIVENVDGQLVEGYIKIQDLVKEYIGNLYNISGDLLDYVFSLYEYESSFDYKDIKDIKHYIYNIKITLI